MKKNIVWTAFLLAMLGLLVLGNQVFRDRREIASLRAEIQRGAERGSEAPSRLAASIPVTDSTPRRAEGEATKEVPTPPAASGSQLPPVPDTEQKPEGEVWLDRFDRAMDKEFSRLERRTRQTKDPEELEVLRQLSAALVELDEVWRRMDQKGTTEDEREALLRQSQEVMGNVIRLAATDRNRRLSLLAHSMGVTNEYEIALFVSQVDQIVRETHLDWSSVFTRGF